MAGPEPNLQGVSEQRKRRVSPKTHAQVFNGAKHVSLRALPGMKERSIRLGSAGKTFSFTAWKVRSIAPACLPRPAAWQLWGAPTNRLHKVITLARGAQVGWMTGPAALLGPIIKAHQFMVFTVPSNLQRAVAYGLDNESSFYL